MACYSALWNRNMAGKKEMEYRFLIVGKSGCGKSSTANNIMGEKLFQEGTGLASCTQTCEIRKSSKPQKGVTFRIADTPGLFDPTKSNDEIKDQIIKAFASLHPGLHAILYVLKVDRYTPEERQTFRQLENLFDPKFVNFIIIVFTRGDELKQNKKDKSTLILEADEHFKQIVRDADNRVIIFNNKKRDSNQIKELLEMVDKIWKENGEVPYSCPMQDFVNGKLESRVTVRTKERIEEDPKLKKLFSDMAEDVRIAKKKTKDQQSLVDDIKERKETTETMIAEKTAAKEKEEQERKEKEKQDLEEKKKLEEEKECRRKEEEKKAEEKKLQQEVEQLKKQVEQMKLEENMKQKLVEERKRIEENYEKKLDAEKKKYEKEEMEKTKQDIVQNKETAWSEDVLKGAAEIVGGAWKWGKGLFGL